MDLDPQIAETIVNSLKDIINHEINLFDTTGTIIASTDLSRIGTSHDGARLALSTRQTVSIDNEHQFKGARQGINVPVLFNDSPVAVIGITGDRSEVEPFGNVIKKMTEILIRENWEQITRFDQRTRLANLVNLLCLRKHDTGLVDYLASVLDIDLSRPRLAVVGRLSDAQGARGTESPYNILYARFQQMPKSFFSVDGKELCMFIDQAEERKLTKLLQGIERDFASSLHVGISLGIGDVAESQDGYWRSYDEATKAAEWVMFTGNGTTARYADLGFGVILSAIPKADAERFVQRVFGDIPQDQLDGLEKVFDAYTKRNGSISQAADDLFLHKNTLQNRLNKLAKLCGFNPRDLADHAVLTMAFLLRRYLAFEQGRAPSKDGAES